MADLNLDRLEELREKALNPDLTAEDAIVWSCALHNAAPALIAAARRLEALEETMLKLYGPKMYWPRELLEADQIEKERAK